jgi:betaine-aldehyde dehydrogenase
MKVFNNVINGKSVPAQSGKVVEVFNPSTGAIYATAPDSSIDDVNAAMQAAADAFILWKETTPSERQRALLRIADAMEDRIDEIVAIECENTGKPIGITRSDELPPTIDHIRFFAGAARNLEGKSAGEYMRGMTSFIRREPVGVCAQITPWNYPLMMAVWKWAPAIAAGNTVVLKPSTTTPASTVWMAQLMAEILPPGVFNVVCGDRHAGKAMIEHPIPQMVSITGSVRAGIEVATSAAKDVKRVHLELGGKAPVIVFNDADLEAAAAGIAAAGLFNAGQDCTSGNRVIVQAGIYDKFVSMLSDYVRTSIKVGSPEEDVFMGPLNSIAHFNRVKEYVDNAPSYAKIQTGGKAINRPGYFYEPTVISDLQQNDELIQEEVFGPVITMQKFDTEAEALEMANGVNLALSASVWTKDHGTAMRITKGLDFGVCWINAHMPFVAEMPHGGFKHSGYGKDLSAYGFEDYTRIKHVMSNINS